MGAERRGGTVSSDPRRLRLLLWLPVPLLLWWALKDFRFGDTMQVLSRLRGLPLAALAGTNLLFLLIVTARWGLILRGLGVSVPLAPLGLYRLAGFAVSYLTPGPQFGGEPVQLALAKRRSNLGYGPGYASILIDKALELTASFAFLVVGAWAILATGIRPAGAWGLLAVPAALAALPALYLAGSLAGRRPLARLFARLPSLSRLAPFLASVEERVAAFGRGSRWRLGLAAGSFVLVWATSLLEMRLALGFLGVAASWGEALALVAGSRFAFLVPVPAALGVLETTQVSLFALLGFPPEAAHALLLYIRARDLGLAAAGLAVAGLGLRRAPRSALRAHAAAAAAAAPALPGRGACAADRPGAVIAAEIVEKGR